MKTKMILLTLLVISIIFILGFTNNDYASSNKTIIPFQTTLQATVPLAGASTYAVLAGSSITNTGETTVTGNLGLSPGLSAGGFSNGISVWPQQINSIKTEQAKLDLTTAYNDAAGRTSNQMVTLSGNIGGLTLTPGLYKSISSMNISSGDLTFDALGDSSAVFIMQIASSLITKAGREVHLKGGASASNIFWQVGSTATFGICSAFKGTVMALQTITFDSGATLDGRAFAQNGGVILAGNTIVKE